eukprot:Skav216319  [mRNA]  locus=scaffold3892:58520:63290:- [translate_table: standard]
MLVDRFQSSDFLASGTKWSLAVAALALAAQVDYLCQKYEALQKQLASVERLCTEQVQRREQLQHELLHLRELQRPQDALAAELAARQASLLNLRESARAAKQDAVYQSSRLKEEQLAGARAEQRCAQLAEECKQRSLRYDQALAQPAMARDLNQLEMQRSMATAEAEACGQRIAELETAIKDSRLQSIQAPGTGGAWRLGGKPRGAPGVPRRKGSHGGPRCGTAVGAQMWLV